MTLAIYEYTGYRSYLLEKKSLAIVGALPQGPKKLDEILYINRPISFGLNTNT